MQSSSSSASSSSSVSSSASSSVVPAFDAGNGEGGGEGGEGESEWSVRETSLFSKHEWQQEPALVFSRENGNLPVFSRDKDVEGARPGSKTFLSTSYHNIWSKMVREKVSGTALCYYEILVPRPCHFHVDAEWYFLSNPEVDRTKDAPEMAHKFVMFVANQMVECGYADRAEDVRVTLLDSTTATKWSCHMVFWLAGGRTMFENNFHCGAFFRRLFRLAREDDEMSELFFFRGEKAPLDGLKDSFVADESIYSLNRNFRLVGSGKWNRVPFWPFVIVRSAKPVAECLVSDDEIARARERFDEEWMTMEDFLITLVQRCPAETDTPKIVKCMELSGAEPTGGQGLGERQSHSFPSGVSNKSGRLSDFDEDTDSPRASSLAVAIPDDLEPAYRATIEGIEQEWEDPAMTGTVCLQWYNPSKKTLKLKCRGHFCRNKEAHNRKVAQLEADGAGREYLEDPAGERDRFKKCKHKNCIFFVVDLIEGTAVQGCYAKTKNSCTIVEEGTLERTQIVSPPFRLSKKARDLTLEYIEKEKKTEGEKEVMIALFLAREGELASLIPEDAKF